MDFLPKLYNLESAQLDTNTEMLLRLALCAKLEGCWLNFMSPIVKPCKLYSHDRPALPRSTSFLCFSPLFPNRPKLPREEILLLLPSFCISSFPSRVRARSLPDKTARVAINSFETAAGCDSLLFLEYGLDFWISPTCYFSGES